MRATLTATAAALLCCLLSPAALADNAIQRENALPGTGQWNAATTSQIEVYASQISAVPGAVVDVHVNTHPPARYRLEIYRLGWYGGAGGRLMGCVPSCTGES